MSWLKDAIPPPSQEVVEHQLHEDVKDDQLPHIKAIEPEEESIELENIAKTNEVTFFAAFSEWFVLKLLYTFKIPKYVTIDHIYI